MVNNNEDKLLKKRYNEIIKGHYANYKERYMSFFLKNDGNEFIYFKKVYKDVLILEKRGLPFEKINHNLFVLIENYARGVDYLIHETFCLIYLTKDYDLFADFLCNLHLDNFIISANKVLEDADYNFFKMIKAEEDIYEMIASYAKRDDSYILMEITYSLLAINWIDKTYDFDRVYSDIKDLISLPKSVEDFCLMKGIEPKFITVEKSLSILEATRNYHHKILIK